MARANLFNLVGPIGYDESMNETQFVDTTARYLVVGDVLTGSGFKVAYVGSPDGSGRVRVDGAYPLSEVRARYWNENTTLTVRRLTTSV